MTSRTLPNEWNDSDGAPQSNGSFEMPWMPASPATFWTPANRFVVSVCWRLKSARSVVKMPAFVNE